MNNKVIFITGASSGIGCEIAKEMAKQGAKVMMASRNVSKLHEIRNQINENGGISNFVKCDVQSENEVRNAIEETNKIFGDIDVAVLNAGIQYIDEVNEACMKEIEEMYETNVIGLIRCAKEILPSMIDRKCGNMVFVSSIMGDAPFPVMVPYGSTKGAISSFARGLRREVAQHGIKITLFLPGHTKTNISNQITNKLPSWYGKSSGSLEPSYVAKELVKFIGFKKQILVGKQSKVMSRLVRFMPTMADKVIRKITMH